MSSDRGKTHQFAFFVTRPGRSLAGLPVQLLQSAYALDNSVKFEPTPRPSGGQSGPLYLL